VHKADSSIKSTKLVKITKMQNIGNGGDGRSGNPGGCFEPLTVFQNINLNKKRAFWFRLKKSFKDFEARPSGKMSDIDEGE
jgi:hypothetical protein